MYYKKGVLKYNSNYSTDVLYNVKLKYIDDDICEKELEESSVPDFNIDFCAGDLETQKDTCQGILGRFFLHGN